MKLAGGLGGLGGRGGRGGGGGGASRFGGGATKFRISMERQRMSLLLVCGVEETGP